MPQDRIGVHSAHARISTGIAAAYDGSMPAMTLHAPHRRSPRSRRSGFRLAAALLASAAAGVLLGGCGPSRWEAAFEPVPAYGDAGFVGGSVVPATAATAAEDAAFPVTVREIPWERMAAVLEEESAALSASDEHPEDWSVSRQMEHRAMLLRGLQVSGDPAAIAILGRSRFRTLGAVHPLGGDRPEIEAQARRVGATDAVVATTFLGRVDTIEDRPITVYGFSERLGPRGLRDTDLRTGTVWVPVRTEADQIGVVAFFLRRIAGDG